MSRAALVGWLVSMGRLVLSGLVAAVVALLGTITWAWWRGRSLEPGALSTPFFYVTMIIIIVGGFFFMGGSAAAPRRMADVFTGYVPDYRQQAREQVQSWSMGWYLICTGLWGLGISYVLGRM